MRCQRPIVAMIAVLTVTAMLSTTVAAASPRRARSTPCMGTIVSRQGLSYENIHATGVGCRTARRVVRAWVKVVADNAQSEEEYAASRIVLDGWICRGTSKRGTDNPYLSVACHGGANRLVTFIGGS